MLKIFSPGWSPFDLFAGTGREVESTSSEKVSGNEGKESSLKLPNLFCHSRETPCDPKRKSLNNCRYQRSLDREPCGEKAVESDVMPKGAGSGRGKQNDLVRTSWEAFVKVVGSDEIEDLLWMDGQKYFCDKYHLAMVYVYFKRTRLPLKEYTARNFLCLLHLAHCMDEATDFKDDILSYAVMGKLNGDTVPKFLANRDRLLEMMSHRAYVSFRTCCEVMELVPHHPMWQRERYSIASETP